MYYKSQVFVNQQTCGSRSLLGIKVLPFALNLISYSVYHDSMNTFSCSSIGVHGGYITVRGWHEEQWISGKPRTLVGVITNTTGRSLTEPRQMCYVLFPTLYESLIQPSMVFWPALHHLHLHNTFLLCPDNTFKKHIFTNISCKLTQHS